MHTDSENWTVWCAFSSETKIDGFSKTFTLWKTIWPSGKLTCHR
jgi:hypothetical protein